MSKSRQYGYNTSSIQKKTTFAMVCIAIGVASFVGVMSAVLYATQYILLEQNRTNETATTTARLLKNEIENLNRSVVVLLSNETVYNIYTNSEKNDFNENFYEDYIDLQPLFDNLLNSQPLVQNLMLLCENGEIYSTYATGLDHSTDSFIQEFNQKTTTWLPSKRVNSTIATGDIIPVAIPVEYKASISFSPKEQAPMVLVLFLSVENLRIEMERMNRSAFSSNYLVSEQGVPINLPKDSRFNAVFESEDYKNQSENLQEQGSFITNIDGEIYSVTLENIGANDLRFVSIVSYDEMINDVLSILIFTVISVFVGSSCAIFFSKKLAHSITNPILKLVDTVQQVRKGNYDTAPIKTNTTELKALNTAIKEMAKTIDRQITEIRNEETYRRKAEMDALTEQINPHFLYNTLECCHWEVLNNNSESAANMIESLGAFLRLSLNKGNDKIMLAQAVEHAKQYINIMNFRTGANIAFFSLLDREVENFLIPKMILQPLVENSIMHGFNINNKSTNVQVSPEIKILAQIEEKSVTITVQDNGEGINIEKAQNCLKNTGRNSDEGHVGLSNVYRRLQFSFEDNVEMEFSSMPFYENSVKIIIKKDNF